MDPEAAPMKDTTRQTGPGAYVRIKDGREVGHYALIEYGWKTYKENRYAQRKPQQGQGRQE